MIFAQVVIITFLILFLKSSFINGAVYDFIPANDEIFEPCPEIPNNTGVHDIFDLSEFVIEYADGKISGYGNATAVWDIKPTDRVQLRGELYKFNRSAWQHTPYTLLIRDFCSVIFKSNTIWYNAWTHAVHETDRVCLNNKGQIYHHEYFSADTSLEMITFAEGRYKFVVTFEAFDKNNVKNPSFICTEIPGEFIKL